MLKPLQYGINRWLTTAHHIAIARRRCFGRRATVHFHLLIAWALALSVHMGDDVVIKRLQAFLVNGAVYQANFQIYAQLGQVALPFTRRALMAFAIGEVFLAYRPPLLVD